MEDEIEIKIRKRDGSLEGRMVKAKKIGSLAVHFESSPDFESDEYVISNIHQGLKFPGTAKGFKAAVACAEELLPLTDWDRFDGKDEHVKVAAKQILKEWGFE